jgi:hypothetical protein
MPRVTLHTAGDPAWFPVGVKHRAPEGQGLTESGQKALLLEGFLGTR